MVASRIFLMDIVYDSTYDAVRCRETQEDSVRCEQDGRKMPRSFERYFQVDFLSAGAWNHGTKFQPDEQTTEGQSKSENPEHHGCTDRPDGLEDGRWRGEDASADDVAHTVQ